MNRVGILATLQARPGKEIKVEEFLKSATPVVAAEVGTTAWFAFKVGRRRLASLIPSTTNREESHTSMGKWPRHSSLAPKSCSLPLRRFRW